MVDSNFESTLQDISSSRNGRDFLPLLFIGSGLFYCKSISGAWRKPPTPGRWELIHHFWKAISLADHSVSAAGGKSLAMGRGTRSCGPERRAGAMFCMWLKPLAWRRWNFPFLKDLLLSPLNLVQRTSGQELETCEPSESSRYFP